MEQETRNKVQHATLTGKIPTVSKRASVKHEQESTKSRQTPSPAFDNLVLFRSVLNDLPLAASFLIGSIIIWINFLLKDSTNHLFGYEPLSLIPTIFTVSFGVLCLVIAFRRYNVRYVIAQDGIKALRGIISNNQVDAKLEYYQIRGTEIHRSLFERLIGTGDLHVRGSSTSNDAEVAFRGIYDPYRYQKVIQERHRIKVEHLTSSEISQHGNLMSHEART